ncbi:MAG: hypothetical protein AAF755_08935 [Pseudomonadota bacterium]
MQVLHLSLFEQVSVDQDRLSTLYAQLGETGAEEVVCRALEELALRLAQCETRYHEGAWPMLRKNARSLSAIAEQIGMTGLSTVAQDVTRCIDQGDHIALAATLSRLLRIGERSLIAIWDNQHLPL